MKNIVADNRVVLPHVSRALEFYCWGKDAVSIGQYSEDKVFEAGIVLDQWQRHDAHVHLVVMTGCSFTRRYLKESFAIPFKTHMLDRISVCVRASNIRSINLSEHVGFVHEGIKRSGYTDGEDMVMLGMLRSECKWL